MILNSTGRVAGGPPNPDDSIVTYLPLCHVAERIFSTWTWSRAGAVLNFAESIETVTSQPARGPADAVLRRSQDLGEDRTPGC